MAKKQRWLVRALIREFSTLEGGAGVLELQLRRYSAAPELFDFDTIAAISKTYKKYTRYVSFVIQYIQTHLRLPILVPRNKLGTQVVAFTALFDSDEIFLFEDYCTKLQQEQ